MNDPTNIKKISGWLGAGSINVFGMPFAGKDTQGNRLAGFFDAPLIGGGDILRNSKLSERIKTIMNRGELIPTEDYLNIVTPYLSQQKFVDKPIILSALGRVQGEEKVIVEAAQKAGHPLKAVIMLKMTEDEVYKRWQKLPEKTDRHGRADDGGEIIKTRLEEFRLKTQPVIDFYKQQGLLIEVDGSKSPDEVTELIIDALLLATEPNN